MRQRSADTDVLVIGAGAAGLAAAHTALRHGLSATLVTDASPGGDCTFTGCIPSKTLLHAAAQELPFADALRRVRETVAKVAASENADVLRGKGVDVIRARARFVDSATVEAAGRRLRARRIVIATGGCPAVPPLAGIEDVPYLTTETVFDLSSAPKSLAILGGGAVGCELAQAFARLGIEVTLIETERRLLPAVDPEASAVLTDALVAEGVRIRTRARADSVRDTGGGTEVDLAGAETVHAEHLLVATGRKPATADLGLDAAGVSIDSRGFVTVDRRMRTAVPGISAAGDVTGLFPHTHGAYAMGQVAVTAVLSGRRAVFDPGPIPKVVFTDPEIAIVGLSEHERLPRSARIARLSLADVDRAVTTADTRGFIKLIAGRRGLLGHAGGGKLLGATIVAERAGETIHEPALAMRTGMFTGRLAQTVHAYPTYSLGIQQAAAQFFGY